MRNRLIVSLVAAVAMVSACHKATPKTVSFAAAFSNLPMPPGGTTLANEAGTDAMQLVVVSPLAFDSMASFYRTTLSSDPYHLVNDRTAGKSVSLYAEQDNGPPLWVTIVPNGTEGSQVTIAGARDSDKRDTSKVVKTADSNASAPLPVKKP